MSKRNRSNAARRFTLVQTDEELLDGLDGLVRDAASGDSRAVGILAITFAPTLNDEAREELGPEWEQDSGDVLQELFLAMCEGSVVFPSAEAPLPPRFPRAVTPRLNGSPS